MKEIFEIVDAVVSELNGHTFAESFTAEKSYVPGIDLKDLGDLKVLVVPESKKELMVSRNSVLNEYIHVYLNILTIKCLGRFWRFLGLQWDSFNFFVLIGRRNFCCFVGFIDITTCSNL